MLIICTIMLLRGPKRRSLGSYGARRCAVTPRASNSQGEAKTGCRANPAHRNEVPCPEYTAAYAFSYSPGNYTMKQSVRLKEY